LKQGSEIYTKPDQEGDEVEREAAQRGLFPGLSLCNGVNGLREPPGLQREKILRVFCTGSRMLRVPAPGDGKGAPCPL